MNKEFIFIILTLILTVSYIPGYSQENDKENDPGFTLTVKTQDLDSNFLYLSKNITGDWEDIDSSEVIPGELIHFEGELKSPQMLYLRLRDSVKTVPFFAENSSMVILPNFIKPESSVVSGSSVHDEYMDYWRQFNLINVTKDAIYETYEVAEKVNDREKMRELLLRIEKLDEEELEINKQYLSENKDSWISPYILRANMYHKSFTKNIEKMVDSLSAKVQNSVYISEIENYLDILEKVAIGKEYTDFEMKTPEGETLALSDLTGEKYVLVDFWASWCQPCLATKPELIEVYYDLKHRGFEILGVSLDSSRKNWTGVIRFGQLPWYQVSDLSGWNNKAARIYGVKRLPHSVLINPEGIIVDKNLAPDSLREKLEELLPRE